MKPSEAIPTLERPLYLLGFFSEEQPYWGLSELARASGWPKATCLRSLRALENHGLLVKENERYRLGTRLVHLGALVKAAYPARQVALPLMQALRDATGQSVQWVVRDGLEGVYLEVLEARSRVRLYIAPGRRAPLYAGASTRLLLAFAPEAVQRAVFTGERKRYTPATPLGLPELKGLLAQTQQSGFAASFGELEPHSAELATPIRGAGGEVLAALSLAGAEALYREEDRLVDYLKALDRTAEEISRRLGYVGPWQADLRSFLRTLQTVGP
ncbi:IclR family transcriptional regulator [Calidithermus roseus]|uniref:HTH-type transcriptional regulator KipR n=1 Tax=Calidithermus roseus TaxID=1644118 RepID=A0A399ES32_9DEIN|nr:IclR family transcriptional regulator [Calidithermus roseus]RIH86778.1 HTH-type transcriptional regulator KipR [Calidithermus roseus]